MINSQSSSKSESKKGGSDGDDVSTASQIE